MQVLEKLSSGSKDLKDGTGTLSAGLKNLLGQTKNIQWTWNSAKRNEAKKDGIISKRSNFDTQLEAFNTKLMN
mgnify:CR=1 FL=1